MEYSHKPVLYDEVIKGLNIKSGGVYIDATLGGGGHFTGILRKLDKEGYILGIDQDFAAIENAEKNISREDFAAGFDFEYGNFENIDIILKKKHIGKADGILFDLGVSSHQLDTPGRGFSYNHDAMLDMRMNEGQKLSAWDVINKYPKEKLKKIFLEYGEERWSARIADFIEEARKRKEIMTTFELVDIIKSAIPKSARREGPHPAKRIFQAIRIEVNDEIGILENTIRKSSGLLKAGGRMLVISFHSLEDRIVKKTFAQLETPCICPKGFPVCVCGKTSAGKTLTKKPILAGQSELDANPRARSAKLRIFEKGN